MMFFDYMKPGEEEKVANFVWSVFEEFEASGYKKEGINEFKNFILPEKMKVRCESGKIFILCCKDMDEIVGVISIRESSHISLLFVKKEYQRRGIARRLFELALEKCCTAKPNLQVITVNSSLYAVGIYEKMGFEATDSEQEKDGIIFTPMKLTVNL
ncbi:MAG: Histone acetyltransferase HPA2-related acetyltransferase [Firmicutes bacterium]|nr:Histone acetyltransferase HPA2-related acetyltransferase [Bacillota bacterium]